MQLSIIVVNYNVRYFLEQCLLSVQAASKNVAIEIIVVDNNSSDESCKIVKEKFPEVLLIENKENVGFSKANNQGVAVAKGDYILILNPDTVIAEDTFEKLLTFTETSSVQSTEDQGRLGCVGVKLVDGKGNFLPESKRNLPTPKVALGKVFGNSSSYYVDHIDQNEVGKVTVLVGAFMFLKKSVYQEVGGFDESYFMYGEDIDLSYKVEKAGYINYYLGEIATIHYKGESTKKDVKYLKHFHKAMEIFYRKHFNTDVFNLLLMRVGIWFWYLLKFFQLSKSKPTVSKPKSIIYVGTNETTFENIKKVVIPSQAGIQKTIKSLNSVFKNEAIDQVIFDNNSITNKEIIGAIESLKKYNISFRIIPKSTDFYIGSDSSVGRGEVISFFV